MQGLVAIRFNAALKEKYQAFIAAGKPPKVALIAIMRKLAILENALLRDQREWHKTWLDQDGYSSVGRTVARRQPYSPDSAAGANA